MQVQLSQSTAIQIRDASSQRAGLMELQEQNEQATAELKELRREKRHWDEKFGHVLEQAGREKAAANARIAQLENDVRTLLTNVKANNSR